jgi:hypothetical protein
MRVLKDLNVPQDNNAAKFPDGQIQNETAQVSGTPVIREVYGDILTNIYAILRSSGIVANGLEDDSLTEYQLLTALKLFHNDLNDKNQVLTIIGETISINLNLDTLPNDYVFIGKLSDALISGTTYTFTGTGNAQKTITPSVNMAASGTVLLTLGSPGCSLVFLPGTNGGSTNQSFIGTSLGDPISFNSSESLIFFRHGFLTTSEPKTYDIQSQVRVQESDSGALVLEVVVVQGKLLAICFINNTTHKIYAWSLNDLTQIESQVAAPITAVNNFLPYMFCDGVNLFFTNSGLDINSSTNDYDLGKFIFNPVAFTIVSDSSFAVDNQFEKTTNIFVNGGVLNTVIKGQIYAYGPGVSRAFVKYLDSNSSQVFKFKAINYLSNGSIGEPLNL